MFDKLIELVVRFIALFRVFVFVDYYEEGVILRRGNFHRVVKPGPRLVQPAGQDRLIVVNVKPEPMYLDVQSLHTADDYASNIQVGIIWRVVDTKVFLLDNEDTEDIVGMLCAGVVSRSLHKVKWAGVREDNYPATLKAPMNRKIRKYGAEIDEVVIQDFATGTANRIWHEGISLAVGEG